GKREIPGVVWGAAEGHVTPSKLKSVVSKYNLPPMPAAHRQFLDWFAQYTMNDRGSVLKMSLSIPKALEEPKKVMGYRLTLSPVRGGNPSHQKILEILSDGKTRRPAELAEMAGVSAGVLKTMAKKGLIQTTEIHSSAPCRFPDIKKEGPKLSPDQHAAAMQLQSLVRDEGFSAVLLDGVTGAGKTEVYFEAVAEALQREKQVLILLPEIALTSSFLDRFKKRFGCVPALWHSNLTPAQRRTTWRGVATGETKVIAGARSALMLPYQNLGLIIVDEEHDPAYKQEEGIIYHARDMAVARAHIEKIPVVLVSATPSLETIHNVWNGRYRHLHLPGRFGGATLPDISLIDLREDKPERQHFIAPTLKKAVADTLAEGGQALLFLNRRGYAPLTLCRTCGHRMNCPRCTAWLVEHKQSGSLHCHHCDYHMKLPKNCPSCNDINSFAVCGPGVERIYEETKAAFPQARIMLMASDTVENTAQLLQMLDDIRERRVDIIIGTQIIAKGHHFPGLTLVGVIDADLGLGGGELRAAERTYQLLHQVAGRAGREEKKGRVYLQTFMPEHKIMKALAAGERDKFLEAEAYERERADMPPYSRLAGIIVSGRDEEEVKYIAKELGRSAPQAEGIQTLGPAPAPFARLRGKYRHRLLVRADKNLNIQKAIEGWIGGIKIPSSVKVAVDIDPQSFF
ncbi:MAG: primosomal protein N', partial [Alphaproteobacteria bacterium]|nr:primosomal protein N' [Alphaproteobacteria bacterium]